MYYNKEPHHTEQARQYIRSRQKQYAKSIAGDFCSISLISQYRFLQEVVALTTTTTTKRKQLWESRHPSKMSYISQLVFGSFLPKATLSVGKEALQLEAAFFLYKLLTLHLFLQKTPQREETVYSIWILPLQEATEYQARDTRQFPWFCGEVFVLGLIVGCFCLFCCCLRARVCYGVVWLFVF